MAENRLQRPDGPQQPPAPTFGQPPAGMPPSGTAPASPTGPGASVQQSQPHSRRPLLIIGCVVLALVLLGAGSIAVIGKVRAGNAAAPDVSAVVREYLTAVAAGDAERAIGLLAQKPENTSLMTARVLRVSRRIAPITDIAVRPVSEEQPGSVPVSYKIGGEPVQAVIGVRTVNDAVLIEGGYATLAVGSLSGRLPLTLNGTKVAGEKVALFPGSYRFGTPIAGVGLGAGAGFVITSAQDSPIVALQPVLTKKGQQRFRSEVEAAIADCISAQTIEAGCGLTVPGKLSGGRTVVDDSVKRELSPTAEDSLKDLTAVLDPRKPNLVRPAGLYGAVRTTATCEVPQPKKAKKKEPKTETCELTGAGTVLGIPVLDLTKKKDAISWQ